MMIKKLHLYNFGIYAGENSFDFSLDKPIVLIGGMNGHGKTTFLEAIVLSLYGSNAASYKESGYKTYGQYLRSLINRDSWNQQTFVELTFIINDGSPVEYTVNREWNANSKHVSETIHVSKNGVYNEFLTNNWSMFVENIVPSALSSFYFFDGEKIAELALDESNVQLRASIRSMLGLNILDVLKNDLNKTLKKRSRQQGISLTRDAVQALKLEQEDLSEAVHKKESEIATLETQLYQLQEDINSLQNRYASKGGKVIEQKTVLLKEKAELTASLEQTEAELLSIAANELPLIMVKTLIQDIKLQAEDEYNELIMKQLVERIDVLLQDYLSHNSSNEDACQDFIGYIKAQTDKNTSVPIYQVSDFALFQLNNLLDNTLQQVKSHTIEMLGRKKELQSKLTEIQSHLSLDINEDELSKITLAIKEKQEKLVAIHIQLNNANQELSSQRTTLSAKSTEVKSAIDSYLSEATIADENARMDKFTHIALQILDAYSVALQSKKSEVLANTITNCYHKLANKQRLIEKINVDPETLEISYLDHNNQKISSNSLSAGEKQLMVVSVLWALAICSKKKLPVIIDTPLSRLDSIHRVSVVQNYFPNASDQTIILSTDSEIGPTYFELMKNNVGDTFTLEYDEESRSTTIVKGYFNS